MPKTKRRKSKPIKRIKYKGRLARLSKGYDECEYCHKKFKDNVESMKHRC